MIKARLMEAYSKVAEVTADLEMHKRRDIVQKTEISDLQTEIKRLKEEHAREIQDQERTSKEATKDAVDKAHEARKREMESLRERATKAEAAARQLELDLATVRGEVRALERQLDRRQTGTKD